MRSNLILENISALFHSKVTIFLKSGVFRCVLSKLLNTHQWRSCGLVRSSAQSLNCDCWLGKLCKTVANCGTEMRADASHLRQITSYSCEDGPASPQMHCSAIHLRHCPDIFYYVYCTTQCVWCIEV